MQATLDFVNTWLPKRIPDSVFCAHDVYEELLANVQIEHTEPVDLHHSLTYNLAAMKLFRDTETETGHAEIGWATPGADGKIIKEVAYKVRVRNA